jgi:hypothetical protein
MRIFFINCMMKNSELTEVSSYFILEKCIFYFSYPEFIPNEVGYQYTYTLIIYTS